MWNYPEPFVDCVEVTDMVAFYWDAVEAWFEEDEEVFGVQMPCKTTLDGYSQGVHKHRGGV